MRSEATAAAEFKGKNHKKENGKKRRILNLSFRQTNHA
jgi:hypothetical protein